LIIALLVAVLSVAKWLTAKQHDALHTYNNNVNIWLALIGSAQRKGVIMRVIAARVESIVYMMVFFVQCVINRDYSVLSIDGTR
jgi:hypothetical protein